MKIISLQQLISGRNDDFDESTNKCLIRLSDTNGKKDVEVNKRKFDNVHRLYVSDKERVSFKAYVSKWTEDRYKTLKKHKYWVVTVGENGTTARLLKVYQVVGCNDNSYKFDLIDVPGMEILEGRVIVDWGGGTQQIIQCWNNTKEVEAIDKGIAPVPFVSYNDVLLSYDELADIINNEYEEWKMRLDKVNCIYCITDKNNGKLYIGSTYSKKKEEGGIWNRWKEYVKTEGHGDNEMLMKLKESYRKENLQWSILEILDHNIKNDEATSRENLYKDKFRTRKFGYNELEGK